jgi:hypothetical protein
LIEPTGYDTDWAGRSAAWADPSLAYAPVHEIQQQMASSVVLGNPEATGAAILALVDAANPPLRLFLGTVPLEIARSTYEQRLATWEHWKDLSSMAQGN